MEFRGKIQEISQKQTRTFDASDGSKQTVEYVTMILNDGLNCIACETATTNIARGVLGEGRDNNVALKKGDSVHAWLITRCSEQKTKDGGTFMANRTKVYHIAKIPDFPEKQETPAF